MPTSVDIKNLKINKLTEAQYDTAVQGGVIGENELSILTDAELEQIQRASLPTASADKLGNIYQFVGTTDANYTNGYFYKCVSDGQNPATYSWERTDVQPAGSSLPSQSGNAGKFLTTDGTDASWANALTNKSTSINGVIVGGTNGAINYLRTAGLGLGINCNGNDSTCIGYETGCGQSSVAIGSGARAAGQNVVSIGRGSGNTSTTNKESVFIGVGTTVSTASVGSVAIGYYAKPQNEGAIAIGKRTISSGVYSVAIGGCPDYSGYNGAQATGGGSIAIGGGGPSGMYGANASGSDSIAIGHYATASATHAIQIGSGNQTGATNSDANTVKIANANGNYEILSANGTIPTDRFTTTPSADGTYVPTLTISSGVATRTWGAASGGSVPTLTWYNVSTAGNTLTIADTSSAQLVKIYKNGLLLQPTEDYTISGTTLTTVGALVVGDKITTEVF